MLHLPKLHQFEAWFTHFHHKNPSILYSCADDCSIKSIDLRTNQVIYSCKKHDAGVTWLGTPDETNFISEYQILTGSYDGTVRLWDERNLKTGALEEISF